MRLFAFTLRCPCADLCHHNVQEKEEPEDEKGESKLDKVC